MQDVFMHHAVFDPVTVSNFFAQRKEIYYPMNMSRFVDSVVINKCPEWTRQVSAQMVWHNGPVHQFEKQDVFSKKLAMRDSPDYLVAPLLWCVAMDPMLSHIERGTILLDDAQVCFIRNARPHQSYAHIIPRDMHLHGGDYVLYMDSVYADMHARIQANVPVAA